MGHGFLRSFSRFFEQILMSRAENERFPLPFLSGRKQASERPEKKEEGRARPESGQGASTDEMVHRMADLLDRLKEDDRRSLLSMAQKMLHEKQDGTSRVSRRDGEEKPAGKDGGGDAGAYEEI